MPILLTARSPSPTTGDRPSTHWPGRRSFETDGACDHNGTRRSVDGRVPHRPVLRIVEHARLTCSGNHVRRSDRGAEAFSDRPDGEGEMNVEAPATSVSADESLLFQRIPGIRTADAGPTEGARTSCSKSFEWRGLGGRGGYLDSSWIESREYARARWRSMRHPKSDDLAAATGYAGQILQQRPGCRPDGIMALRLPHAFRICLKKTKVAARGAARRSTAPMLVAGGRPVPVGGRPDLICLVGRRRRPREFRVRLQRLRLDRGAGHLIADRAAESPAAPPRGVRLGRRRRRGAQRGACL